MTQSGGARPYVPLGSGGETEADGVSIGQIFSILRRRWLLLCVCVLAISIAGFLIVKLLTPTYGSQAILILAARPDAVVDLKPSADQDLQTDSVIRSEVDALQSRSLVDRIIVREHLMDDPEFNKYKRPFKPGLLNTLGIAKYLPRFLGHLLGTIPIDPGPLTPEQVRYTVATKVLGSYTVSADAKTYTVKISLSSVNAAKSARLTNVFADEYLKEQIDERAIAAANAANWLNPRLVELKHKLAQATLALQEFKDAHHIVDLPGSQGESNTLALQEVQNLTQALATARATQTELEASQEEVRRLSSDPSQALSAPAVAAVPLVETLRVQETTAEAQLASLLGTYGPKHPLVASAKEELAKIRERLAEEARRAVTQLDFQLRAARSTEAQLQGRIDQLTTVRSGETRALPELEELEAQQAAATLVYDAFVQGLTRAATQDGVPTPKGRIIQKADILDYPTFPNVPLFMIIIVVAAVMISGAIVFGLEASDKSFHTPDQIEDSLRLPVLGMSLLSHAAPRLIGKRNPVSRRIVTEPNSAAAEAVRMTRTAITLARNESQPKVILVTSATSGEGKTTLALMLARQAALSGKRAISIEAELRNPSFGRELGELPKRGLVDYLMERAGVEDIIGTDEASGAHFIAAGGGGAKCPERLESPRMEMLMSRLRNDYDLIVIDTPPVTVVADAFQLRRLVDVAVLVVKWGSTPRHLVAEAVRKLRLASVPLIGVVLSQVDERQYRFFGQGALPHQYASEYYSRS